MKFFNRNNKNTTSTSLNITIGQLCRLLGTNFEPFEEAGISPNAIVQIDNFKRDKNTPSNEDKTTYRIAGSPHGVTLYSYWIMPADPYDPIGADASFSENYFSTWEQKNITANLANFYNLPVKIVKILDSNPEYCRLFIRSCRNFVNCTSYGDDNLAKCRLALGNDWGIKYFINHRPVVSSPFAKHLDNISVNKRYTLCNYMLKLEQEKAEKTLADC